MTTNDGLTAAESAASKILRLEPKLCKKREGVNDTELGKMNDHATIAFDFINRLEQVQSTIHQLG